MSTFKTIIIGSIEIDENVTKTHKQQGELMRLLLIFYNTEIRLIKENVILIVKV
jgi:hypothetical protein